VKSRFSPRLYAAAVNRAAMTLLAMCFRPSLESSLIDEVAAAVTARGGKIDGHFVKLDLNTVFEEVVERAMALLSVVLRQRLPGIADEMDEAFGDNLRFLIGRVEQSLPIM
jgi:hypothetical protein